MAAIAASSLTAASDVGPGSTVDFTTAVKNASMILSSAGTVTGGLVAVEVSHDGTVWAEFSSLLPRTGENRALSFSQGAYRYWRANILAAITGGGTVTATFAEAG